jgi:hypothetical protein
VSVLSRLHMLMVGNNCNKGIDIEKTTQSRLVKQMVMVG